MILCQLLHAHFSFSVMSACNKLFVCNGFAVQILYISGDVDVDDSYLVSCSAKCEMLDCCDC
jgi:hypothetical protein